MKTWDWTSVGLAVLLSVASTTRADEPSSQTTAKPKRVYLHGDTTHLYMPEIPQVGDQPKQQDDRKAEPIAPIKVPDYYTDGDDFPSVPPSEWSKMDLPAGPRVRAAGRYRVALGGQYNTLIVLTDTATGRCWVRSLVFDDEGWRDLESPAPAGQ